MEDSVVYQPEAERLFNDAMREFRTGEYERAAEGFSVIPDRFPGSQRVTAAYVMGAKSRYELGELESAEDLLRQFLARYPGSHYVDDAHYTLGLVLFHGKRYPEAAREFILALQAADVPKLGERAEHMLSLLVSANLDIDQARALVAETGSGEVKALLAIRVAEKALNTGNVGVARELLQPIARLPQSMRHVKDAADLLDRIERSGAVKIGVVLPLVNKSDPLAGGGIGEELLQGMHLAVDEHNAEAMPKVNLDVRDSERDAGVAARQVSELSMDNQILAIVGPLFSHEAYAAAGIANERGVPLLTPTATANGIAAIGDYIFQANPDYSVRGRAMAQYAFSVAKARRFAVLSASDTTNRQMSEAFVQEVGVLGGEVVDVQWYNPGETDLRTQLFAIRQLALEKEEPIVVNFGVRLKGGDMKRMVQWGVPQRVLDSLVAMNAMAPVEFLFGANGLRVADSLQIPTMKQKIKYDSLEIPVKYIDAVFLPIASSEEIGIVASQVRYFNFQALLLGTGNWQELNELEQNRQYANGVVFSTDAYWDEISQQYQEFARSFRAAFAQEPTTNAMIGYDAMKLMLKLVRSGATRREEIQSALGTVRMFQGVHAKISLSGNRVNSCLTLLQYRNRVIRKAAEVDVERNEVTVDQGAR